jgi:hypothetical protein
MPKVWNQRDPATPPGAVYVGRPSIWGNPYQMHREADRLTVVEQFRHWILDPANGALLQRARQDLRGKDLVCWCAPKACHADILLALVNEPLDAAKT